MDASALDSTTLEQFKSLVNGTYTYDSTGEQNLMETRIAESQAKLTALSLMASQLRAQTFDELVAYSETLVGYTPVSDPAEDTFLITQLKIVEELRAQDDAAVAAKTARLELGHSQDVTYGLLIQSLEATELENLIDFAETQPGYDPDDDPSEPTFDATKVELLALLNLRKTTAADATSTAATQLQAQADQFSIEADQVEAITYAEFEAFIAP